MNNNNIMILDTEFENSPRRLISLAYIIYDEFNKKKIKEYYQMVKHNPNVFQINEEGDSFKIHKISNMLCYREGKPLKIILNEWRQDLLLVNKIVGHNVINADISILRKECIGLNTWNDIYNIIDTLEIVDTLSLSRNLKFSVENNSLNTIYHYLFNIPFDEHHHALEDCKASLKLYEYMITNYKDEISLLNPSILKYPENELKDIIKINTNICSICQQTNTEFYILNSLDYNKYHKYRYKLYCIYPLLLGSKLCQKCHNLIEIVKYDENMEMLDMFNNNIKKTSNRYQEYLETKEYCFEKEIPDNIILLDCPIKDKEECKKNGGKFHKIHKKWYIDITQNKDLFMKWMK